MSDHPYRLLPDVNFWKPSVADMAFDRVDPVVSAKFRINQSNRVVTAGSCFAQHIARYLRQAGCNYLVTEPANPIVPPHIAERYGYGLFSARYGNVYTSRQLAQLLQRAYGLFEPDDDFWVEPNGRLIDPFRPRIQPNGFASMAEYRADRRQHFAAVRRAVEELDFFLFTLGLTECWVSRSDGAAYPLCPGVAGGQFDESRHAFVNLRVDQVVSELKEAFEIIRSHNPYARFVLTVSPVPLVATAEPRSVLASTVYSKSVLRVAAQAIADADDQVAYFPAYEIITGPHTRGHYFADDLRSVTEAGVSRVMQLFFQHHVELEHPEKDAGEGLPDSSDAPVPQQQALAAALEIMCDEVALADLRAPAP